MSQKNLDQLILEQEEGRLVVDEGDPDFSGHDDGPYSHEENHIEDELTSRGEVVLVEDKYQ